ncbi:hypothetical protein SAMN05428970_3836 [Agromyces sp. CF514]|uniref:hypothetical protein n=1 Tax=Agromyces sp. CF514 TaxID=1881031 RepID=UPI0008E20EB7|nr:hypothetical protein [Agromyces sp. CF514]SFR91740.1 hypothetical protein SAMN05428970_3836 [Agromyces sp. CF514]
MTPNPDPGGSVHPSAPPSTVPDAAGAPSASAGVDAAAAVGALVADAAARLSAAGARTEVLAEYEPPRRVLGIPRAARMTRIGEVWRLGVLLVSADARLYATGRVVRAERAARKSITAESVAEQRALRAAAVKGGIPEGATVSFDAEPVELGALAESGAPAASDPLVVRDGEVFVRWNPNSPDALAPLARYLAERVELLANPPERA